MVLGFYFIFECKLCGKQFTLTPEEMIEEKRVVSEMIERDTRYKFTNLDMVTRVFHKCEIESVHENVSLKEKGLKSYYGIAETVGFMIVNT